MMKYILAGFGGQGVLFIGKVLAQAGMLAKKNVTWIPAYGPEMRGGTANCSVIISDQKIGSPTVGRPDIAVVMNNASFAKFLPTVVPGGTLYVNSSMVTELGDREDINIVRLPVNDIAYELGQAKVANIVMLGAMQVRTPVLGEAIVIEALTELGGKKPELAELNGRAFRAGQKYGQTIMTKVAAVKK